MGSEMCIRDSYMAYILGNKVSRLGFVYLKDLAFSEKFCRWVLLALLGWKPVLRFHVGTIYVSRERGKGRCDWLGQAGPGLRTGRTTEHSYCRHHLPYAKYHARVLNAIRIDESTWVGWKLKDCEIL